MSVGASKRSCNRTLLLQLAASATLALGAAVPSSAVVVEGTNIVLPPPGGGWVGSWYGSSAVPVSQQWFITARHVGGAVGHSLVMRGVQYQSVEIRQHPTLDLQLVRVVSPMPGWHQIAPLQTAGTPVYLGGCGATTLNPLAGGLGWDWAGQHFEAWGRNTIESAGSMLRVRFDSPSSQNAVPQEAAFAINDSGAGLFVLGSGGQLLLAGTAVSVSGGGASAYGSSSYCVSLHTAQDWISGIVGASNPPQMSCNLFQFLSDWFAQNISADFDGNQFIEVADVFSYLSAWFTNC